MSTFRLNETNKEQTEKTTKVQEAPEQAVTETEQNAPATKETVKEVVLKGPMGYAYTEILKILLDKNNNPDRSIRQESVYQAILANVLSDEVDYAPDSQPQNQGFIYVYDGKKMNVADLNKMFDELSAKKASMPETGYVAAVIENPDYYQGPSMDTMVTHLESIGVKVNFNRDTAINNIFSFMRG